MRGTARSRSRFRHLWSRSTTCDSTTRRPPSGVRRPTRRTTGCTRGRRRPCPSCTPVRWNRVASTWRRALPRRTSPERRRRENSTGIWCRLKTMARSRTRASDHGAWTRSGGAAPPARTRSAKSAMWSTRFATRASARSAHTTRIAATRCGTVSASSTFAPSATAWPATRAPARAITRFAPRDGDLRLRFLLLHQPVGRHLRRLGGQLLRRDLRVGRAVRS